MALGLYELTYEGILEALGGQEFLELMIGAKKFKPIPYMTFGGKHSYMQGLYFRFNGQFRGVNKSKTYEAKFAPSLILTPNGMTSYYHLCVEVLERKKGHYSPYCGLNYIAEMSAIVPTFERITNLTLSFT